MTQQATGSMPEWSRPMRVPADIRITHAQPPFAIAGETATWRLPFVLSKDVPAGSNLRLQVAGGRSNKGPFDCKVLTAQLASGVALNIRPDAPSGTYAVSIPSAGLTNGDALTVTLVDCKSPTIRQLNKFFVLYVAPLADNGHIPTKWAGGGVWANGSNDCIVAVCTMHVLGGRIDHFRAYAPSSTMPGEQVSILVRPEDEYDNLANYRPGQLSVFLDKKQISGTLENVDDSTCVRVLVSIQSAGTYRLRVLETDTGREATTNPIICGGGTQVFWGMIHGHTEMSDGTGALEQYFHQLQNEVALDFAASSDHDHLWETSDTFWKTTCTVVRRWHQPGRFVTFLGYECAKWRQNGDGDRNVYYLGDDRPMYRSDDGEYPSPPDLFGALARNHETAIVIPHHTGHGGNFCDWKDHDGTYERLIEIFQILGSYECSEEDGNPVPERKTAVPPYTRGYVREALALGWRVGFTAGGDDHCGKWGTEGLIGNYKQGLMYVEAHECCREAIFAAMYERRVVATTGARMLLTYRLNDRPMGSEISVTDVPELATCRRLNIEFHGTDKADRIDVIRNNSVVYSVPGAGERDISVTWDDRDPLDAVFLPAAKFCSHPFAYYYVRIVQQDGEVAWASPVWIDP